VVGGSRSWGVDEHWRVQLGQQLGVPPVDDFGEEPPHQRFVRFQWRIFFSSRGKPYLQGQQTSHAAKANGATTGNDRERKR
jgi:hypothetical protein